MAQTGTHRGGRNKKEDFSQEKGGSHKSSNREPEPGEKGRGKKVDKKFDKLRI